MESRCMAVSSWRTCWSALGVCVPVLGVRWRHGQRRAHGGKAHKVTGLTGLTLVTSGSEALHALLMQGLEPGWVSLA